MGLSSLGYLFLHQPDTNNDLADSLQCVDELIKEGKVKGLGLSNYHAIEVERAVSLCDANGWTRPSVVQGLYNPLNRMIEEELLPVARKYGMAFVAYNPLAAGLLTGKHRPDGDVAEGRFKGNPNYMPRFYTDANFKALAQIRAACDAAGLGLVPATYAWLARHSALNGSLGDGVLLGASNMAQLEENMA